MSSERNSPDPATKPLLSRQRSLPGTTSYDSVMGSPSRPQRPRKVVSSLRNEVSYEPGRPPSSTTDSSIISQEPSLDQSITWKQRLPYYLPCFSWLPTYTTLDLIGDTIAGLSLASFQIPLALSYATSVAHVPALCGLYALAIPPIIYAVFGSVPQMIVGPEVAISLVVGQAVEPLVVHEGHDPVDLVSIMACIGGFFLLGAGLSRFGFLDNVLSRALLRGFISGVGIVMIINSLYDELGVRIVNPDIPTHFHSPIEKMWALKNSIHDIHTPTALISLVALVVLITTSILKNALVAKGHTKMIFIPEILIVVVASTILSAHYGWKHSKVEVVGKIKTSNMTYNWPFSKEMRALYPNLMTSSILAATLGFFESTTASKSLGSQYDLPISSNRELVALGFCNIFGGLIGALPAFGGYGRSKINAMSGAKTTMSGLIMGLLTLITIFGLLRYLRYLPKCVLSVVTTMVAIRLLEETPSDLLFHWRAGGYSELLVFCITVLATLFYSVEAGVAVGCAYSVIIVIKNSSRSRIQILGRIPGTNTFVNADEPLFDDDGEPHQVQVLEEIEGCLIVKITEPLTFSNTSDLKLRLLRLERYGSAETHPATPRMRQEFMNRNVIFDLKGLTFFDSSASQIFYEILDGYRKRGIAFYFVGVPTKFGIRERLRDSGILALGDGKLFSSIEEVLHIVDAASERENSVGSIKMADPSLSV